MALQVEELVKAIMDEIARVAGSNGKPPDKIWISELAGCLRRAYYERVKPAPRNPRQALRAISGAAIHRLVTEAARRIGCRVEERIDAIVNDVPITGKADIVCDGKVIEIKTVESRLAPSVDHERQVRYYAALLRAREAYILIVDRSTGLVNLVRVSFDPVRAMGELAKRARELWEALRRRRPPKPEKGPWCNGCPYALYCKK